jgi:hypothetical protein
VTGTLHFRVKAALAKGGRIRWQWRAPGLTSTVPSRRTSTIIRDRSPSGNGGISGTGTLAGWSSSTLDKAIDITASFPVGAPLLVYMVLDAVDFTYGNVFVNPGWVETDAGGNSDQYGGAGLQARGSRRTGDDAAARLHAQFHELRRGGQSFHGHERG